MLRQETPLENLAKRYAQFLVLSGKNYLAGLFQAAAASSQDTALSVTELPEGHIIASNCISCGVYGHTVYECNHFSDFISLMLSFGLTEHDMEPMIALLLSDSAPEGGQ